MTLSGAFTLGIYAGLLLGALIFELVCRWSGLFKRLRPSHRDNL